MYRWGHNHARALRTHARIPCARKSPTSRSLPHSLNPTTHTFTLCMKHEGYRTKRGLTYAAMHTTYLKMYLYMKDVY